MLLMLFTIDTISRPNTPSKKHPLIVCLRLVPLPFPFAKINALQATTVVMMG